MKKLLALFAFLPAFACAQNIFGPSPGGPVSITATTSSSSISVPNPNSESQLRIYSTCTTTLFLKTGNSSVTASSSDMAVAPGAVEIFSMSGAYTAVIVPSGSCDVYLSRGTGL